MRNTHGIPHPARVRVTPTTTPGYLGTVLGLVPTLPQIIEPLDPAIAWPILQLVPLLMVGETVIIPAFLQGTGCPSTETGIENSTVPEAETGSGIARGQRTGALSSLAAPMDEVMPRDLLQSCVTTNLITPAPLITSLVATTRGIWTRRDVGVIEMGLTTTIAGCRWMIDDFQLTNVHLVLCLHPLPITMNGGVL